MVVPFLVTPPTVPTDAVSISPEAMAGAAIALYGIVAVSVAVAATGLEPAVRRRVLVLLAAAATLFLVVQSSADASFARAYTAPPVLTGAYRWPVLVGAPVVVPLIGLLTIGLRERRQSRIGPTLQA